MWGTSRHGRLLVTDGQSNAIYWVRVNNASGVIYAEAPDDSGVPAFLGYLDIATGFTHPVALGFGKPTGLAYVPDPGT